MILVGYLCQLPPVKDIPLYASKSYGATLWREFNISISLHSIFRQQGSDLAQASFQNLLLNIRNAIPLIQDWEALMSRSDSSLTEQESIDFKNGPHLFAQNDLVHSHNLIMLKSFNSPIARSIAEKTRCSTFGDTEDDQLKPTVLLCINQKVMLSANLWVEKGLVNDATSSIIDIVYGRAAEVSLRDPAFTLDVCPRPISRAKRFLTGYLEMVKDLSDEQTASMREAFSLFDTDRDGYITVTELGTVMRSLGENPTQAELQDIIKREQIGATVDFPRFLDVMRRNIKGGNFHMQLKDAFKVLDKDGTGMISVAELRHILTSVGEKLEPSEFDQWIREIKVDSNGNIFYEEFIDRMMAK
ncbi:hypothetical protein KI387_011521 [Taxus chinensis]|uniref:EF-hand domain-containing protein n=1 Tax=Taxus chinensis TaxID=29808 RepID=A0AA38CJR9_TAXCH|nr:hypothetical protein KI387_011521 [Taxus chinensis]